MLEKRSTRKHEYTRAGRAADGRGKGRGNGGVGKKSGEKATGRRKKQDKGETLSRRRVLSRRGDLWWVAYRTQFLTRDYAPAVYETVKRVHFLFFFYVELRNVFHAKFSMRSESDPLASLSFRPSRNFFQLPLVRKEVQRYR